MGKVKRTVHRDMETVVNPTTTVQVPPLPIKTYKWEDVRRSRRKGGYPWTYLDKEPFDEEVDPKEFRMDGSRKSKSASTLGKESGVVIEDVTEVEQEKENLKPPSFAGDEKDFMTVELADSSGDDNISQYLDKDDREKDGVSERSEHIACADEDLEPGTSKDKIEVTNGRKGRAKSEEPKRKRKHSVESSYSRISLSKLGVMKKLREAKDKIEKIKLPKMPDMPKLPKLPSFKKSEKPKPSTSKAAKKDIIEIKKEVQKQKLEPKKDEQPVYIYIPLKPPPGETDEFSKFAMEIEEKVEGPEKTEGGEIQEPATPESPESPGKSGVQMIILTAPSDDEILDGPDIPETPSEADAKGFNKERFEDLKTFAKDIIEEISPSREQTPAKEIPKVGSEKALEKMAVDDEQKAVEKSEDKSVDEQKSIEEDADVPKSEEDKSKPSKKKVRKVVKRKAPLVSSQTSEEGSAGESKVDEPKSKSEKMLVDEEDGLKLSEEAVALLAKGQDDNKETDKKEDLKEDNKQETDKKEQEQAKETTPKAKKKVSFKKRTKDDYEAVQGEKETKGLAAAQSMSVDEEKSYLDDKVIKATSLDEDYNKWSKLGDHEYEPINPPPDEGIPAGQSLQLEAQIKDGGSPRNLRKLDSEDSQTSPDTAEEFLTVQEMQSRMEDQFFTQPQKTTPKSKFASAWKAGAKAASAKAAAASSSQPSSSANEEPKPEPTTTREKLEGQGKKIKAAFSTQAGKLKTRMQNIKKPTISKPNLEKLKIQKISMPKMPQKPKFNKPKMPTLPKLKMPEKPKLTMPKLPDKITLPSFTLPKKGTAKRSMKQRQLSTESNAGDSKKKLFDFSTVPRIFSKRKQDDFEDGEQGPSSKPVESATVPRTKTSRWAQKLSEIKQKAVEPETPKKTKEVEKKPEPQKQQKTNSPVYIRIPLHSPESMDRMDKEDNNGFNDDTEASHIRYNQDIDIDDAYERENKEIHKVSPFSSGFKQAERWKHGTFHKTDQEDDERIKNVEMEIEQNLDHPEEPREYGRRQLRDPYKDTGLDNGISESLSPDRRFESPNIHSSSSFSDVRGRGVLEEINSDEFFLRQKGISQDNIEVGAYLSSEIREAFKNKSNSLKYGAGGSLDRDADINVSDFSMNGSSKKKPIRKPKRKKTPTVSKEKLTLGRESSHEMEDIPLRPKRRSKKKKKSPKDDVVPYQETIQVDESLGFQPEILAENILHEPDEGIFYYNERLSSEDMPQMYENEHMKGIEQPEIMVSDPYHRDFYKKLDIGYVDEEPGLPEAPPRKQRSLKSLNASEHDSIMGEFSSFKELPPHNQELYKREIDDYIIPDVDDAPERPRRARSRTRSHSRGPSQPDEEEELAKEEVFMMYENQQPCVEEPCVQDVRDSMGYAIIDKNKMRDPPLPPSRFPPTPPRRRKAKAKKSTEPKFFTVPRPVKDESPPIRPLRNYSTLGPSGPKKKKSVTDLADDEKENIDITQYIEIEEPNRDLHSGEVIQKMRDRPLPAPPRPPRKSRESSKALSDITNGQDLDDMDGMSYAPEETEVSTQTEPLPDDFLGDDYLQDHSDRFMEPTSFDNEETITHGALVIQRFDESDVIPTMPRDQHQTELRETIVPITKEDDYEETEVPEDFKLLKDPPQTEKLPEPQDEETTEIPLDFHELKDPEPVAPEVPPRPAPEAPKRVASKKKAIPYQSSSDSQEFSSQPVIRERIIERLVPAHAQPDSTTDVELLRASKLQVGDLDVNRLTVNELLASKIKVSEIDSASIQVSEINSQGGNLIVSGIELPTNFIKELLEKLQEQAGSSGWPQPSTSVGSSEKPPGQEDENPEQKKTSTEDRFEDLAQIPERPPRRKSEANLTTESAQVLDEDFPEGVQELLEDVHELSERLHELSEGVQELSDDTQKLSDSTQILSDSTQITSDSTQNVADDTHQLPDSSENLLDSTQQLTQEQISEVLEETDLHLEGLSEDQPERPPRLKTSKHLDISLENLVCVDELKSEVPPELPQQPRFELSTENLALEDDDQLGDEIFNESKIVISSDQNVEGLSEEELKTGDIEGLKAELLEHLEEVDLTEPVLEDSELVTDEHFDKSDKTKKVQILEASFDLPEEELEEFPISQVCDFVQEVLEEATEKVAALEDKEIETPHTVQVPILQRMESELFEINSEDALLEHLRNKHFLQRGFYSGDFSDMPPLIIDLSDIQRQSISEAVDDMPILEEEEELELHPEDGKTEIEKQLDETEKQLDEAEDLLDDGEKQLAEGDMPTLESDIFTPQEEESDEAFHEEIPKRPPRKKSLTEDDLASIEAQIMQSLEDEILLEEIPIRPPRQSDLYTIDPTVLAEIESSFIREVQEMQHVPQRPSRQKGATVKELSESEDNLAGKSTETTEKEPELTKSESDGTKPYHSEEPPPRPPEPAEIHPDHGFLPSQPPPSFYDLRSPVFIDFIDEDDIPPPPRRRRQKQQPVSRSRSSSDETPQASSSRRRQRTPEPSIPQLAGQLTRACGTAIDRQLKRLILHITNNVMQNSDGKQDLHVTIVILLVLIAGLILLGFGSGKTIHHHHWEYFNPPKNL